MGPMRGAVVLRATLIAVAVLAAFAGDALAWKRGQIIRVKATAFSDRGTTFTGRPTGRGICAVDPRVIPLGTEFFVYGYGPCIAADIGSAVIGRMIDVWVRNDRIARQWGVRTVRIRFL